MPFQIIRNDITKVAADAIVNSANPEPVCGSGTDSAIYTAAGADELLAERRKIGRIRTGEVAVTPAFALQAKYIIHTVGPIWVDGGHGELEDLSSCYRKSLLIARQLGCESIAFPLISTGVYGFPKDKALEIALREISTFLEIYDMDVTLVVFDRKAFDLSADLVAEVGQFIDEKYVEQKKLEEYAFRSSRAERRNVFSDVFEAPSHSVSMQIPAPAEFPAPAAQLRERAGRKDRKGRRKLSDVMRHMGESFQERLLRLIDERGLADSEVYKKANVDRKLFSKIRCNPDYTPRKTTAVALAVALELNLDETIDLLRRAGLALSPSSKFDLIVEYCIENKIYNIYEINAILFEYEQPMLGC